MEVLKKIKMIKTEAKEKILYTPVKKLNDAVPLWLCFPSSYMIGMSSLGFLGLFRILDENKKCLPERVFTNTEKTRHNTKNVEMMGFSFSFEFDFLGIFTLLEKYSIPFRSSDRSDDHPLIFAGGPVLTANPEPFADFFDFIIIGDGEDVISEIIDLYYDLRFKKTKKEILSELAKKQGVYVPSLYDVEYNNDNSIKKFSSKGQEVSEKIVKRHTINLENYNYSPIVTEKSYFSNTFLIEVARGCPQKCSFCLASYLNFPCRYPDLNEILKAIDKGVEKDYKLGLLGALIASHPKFDEICGYILQKRKQKEFEVSVSSLRADKITPLAVKMLVECGQKTSTIAVESGSERLRTLINKNLSSQEIKESVKIARENGLAGMKIYGMIGLPTETTDDITEFIELLKELKFNNKNFALTLSTSSFVPKANTPFQWFGREETKSLNVKNEYLKKELHQLGIKYRPTSLKWDYIQGIISRGDRRISVILEKVYKYKGSIGSFSRSYKEAVEDDKIYIPEFDWYALRNIPFDEILPWNYIDTGISKEHLIKDQKVL
jgi:radical SAM superfamily enzyme YgiQ (UPF0313 family)